MIPGIAVTAFSLAAVIPPTSWYGTLLAGLFNFTPEPTGGPGHRLDRLRRRHARPSSCGSAGVRGPHAGLPAAACSTCAPSPRRGAPCPPDPCWSPRQRRSPRSPWPAACRTPRPASAALTVAITDDALRRLGATTAAGNVTLRADQHRQRRQRVRDPRRRPAAHRRREGERRPRQPVDLHGAAAARHVLHGLQVPDGRRPDRPGRVHRHRRGDRGRRRRAGAHRRGRRRLRRLREVAGRRAGPRGRRVRRRLRRRRRRDRARACSPRARVFYERIEPTAEAFGDLDPKIDYREVDAVAEGLDWTGFHRIEKDLWPPAEGDLNSDGTSAFLDWAPSTPERARRVRRPARRRRAGAVRPRLRRRLHGHASPTSRNGAIGLLDEVAVGKITGEEDWWSHTDLSDFAANVQGAKVAFGNVKAIAESKGEGDAGRRASRAGSTRSRRCWRSTAPRRRLHAVRRGHRCAAQGALRRRQRPRRAAVAAHRARCSG